MGFFGRLFGRPDPRPAFPRASRAPRPRATRAPRPPQQAVLVHLDDADLPDAVAETCDLATLGERLNEVVRRDGLGEYDGDEVGPTGATVFLYGPDAERLFAGIEPTLRAYPLSQHARVVIRHGPPGAPEREVRL